MQIEAEQVGRVVVLVPHGDMDATTLPAFESRLEVLLGESAQSVLWDLGRVTLLPSTAVGFLLQAGRRVQSRGGRMALANVIPRVRRTLGTMGVGEVFPIYEDRDVALSDLESAGLQPGTE